MGPMYNKVDIVLNEFIMYLSFFPSQDNIKKGQQHLEKSRKVGWTWEMSN